MHSQKPIYQSPSLLSDAFDLLRTILLRPRNPLYQRCFPLFARSGTRSSLHGHPTSPHHLIPRKPPHSTGPTDRRLQALRHRSGRAHFGRNFHRPRLGGLCGLREGPAASGGGGARKLVKETQILGCKDELSP